MAGKAHIDILIQGVDIWNQWRRDNPQSVPDLNGANLFGANLKGANLRGAILSEAVLSGAMMSGAVLNGAVLSRAYLRGAVLNGASLSGSYLHKSDLSGAYFNEANLDKAQLNDAYLNEVQLRGADLSGACLLRAELNSAILAKASLKGANLSEADLSQANLSGANLSQTTLTKANLTGANLTEANLSHAYLSETNFNEVIISATVFTGVDLSIANGLEFMKHQGPSMVGIDTLYQSKGQIPEAFLRGCGLSDWQIEVAKLHKHDLPNEKLGDILYKIHDLRAQQPIQISPLFISYSHADSEFVDRLERYLVNAGIRFWRDVHHATAGRLERQVDRAIRLNPTVLLILSASAVGSDWVEHEVRLARKLEKDTARDVLCPIALDESWKQSRWPERLREQIEEYHILDFSNWKDRACFERMYRRLIEGLDLFYTRK